MSDTVGGDEPLLNRAQIAQIFNVSENTIDKWRGKGMPVEVEGGNGVAYGFLFSACKEWFDESQARAAAEKRAADDFVAQQRMAFLGIDKKDQKAGLSPAQMRELAQAELVWMQAAERRRSLVQVDEMVELLDLVFGEVRAGLDGLPDWLEREFSLSGEDVERVVAYNDGILRAIKVAIEAAALGERPEVVDPLDRGLI
ncbi:terminase small subunit [Rhodobacteraceae bacterium R_SAG3]|nr:terminase small subunit [Rhodobacteraceae bacterium R_SAG3]